MEELEQQSETIYREWLNQMGRADEPTTDIEIFKGDRINHITNKDEAKNMIKQLEKKDLILDKFED